MSFPITLCLLQLSYSDQHSMNAHGSAQPIQKSLQLTTAPKHYTKGKDAGAGLFPNCPPLGCLQCSSAREQHPNPSDGLLTAAMVPKPGHHTKPPGLLKQRAIRYPLCYQTPYALRKFESYGNQALSNPNHLHPQQKQGDLKEVLSGLNLSQVI